MSFQRELSVLNSLRPLLSEAQLGRIVGPQKIGRPRKENRGQSRLLTPANLNLPDL